MLEERMHNRALAALQSNRHWAAARAFVDLFEPAVEGFGSGGHLSGLCRAIGNLSCERVFCLAPVQSHQGAIVFGIHGIFCMAGPVCRLYCVRRGKRRHLEYA